jgi:hypothetical protein
MWVTIRVLCLFPFILLSSFLLFILSSFFPLFLLIVFLCHFLHFIFLLLHLYHLPFIKFTSSQFVFVSSLFPVLLDTVLLSGVTSDIFPELSNHVERVGTLSLRIQAFTKLLKTSAHYNKHNRTETNINIGW